MKWIPTVSYKLVTEGGPGLEDEAIRLANGWLRCYTARTATGRYTFEDGTRVSETALEIEVLVPLNGDVTSCLELTASDKHVLEAGCLEIWNHALVGNYMILLARSIADANGQECVLIVRQDAIGISILYV